MEKRLACFVLIFMLSGCLGQVPIPVETPQPTTQSPQTTSPPKENLLEKYAREKGLSEELVKYLSPAGLDGLLTEERKSAIDYLSEIPKEYHKVAVERIMEDRKLTKEDLKYLLDFQNELSRAKRILSDLKKTNFTLEDGKQTDLEKKYLAEPEKYSTGLFSFYMGELGNDNPDLVSQLQKIPEFKEGKFYSAEKLEALEDIVYLSIQATNPEVKEAFSLMMKGGIPDQKDFSYEVPKYNTELEVLFWLAEQNEFKQDDTLALAIAMVNSLWVTMGDDEVRKAVKKDTNDLLDYFRDTNEWQREKGYYLLEDYPLEAKICLTWTGGDPARGGRAANRLLSGGPTYDKILNIHHFFEFENRPIDINDYKWNTISLDTLKKERKTSIEKKWISIDTIETIKNLEEYFYFIGKKEHWLFTQPNDSIITFKNEQTINHNMNNPNLVFDYYLKNDKGLGVCGDEASLIESISKSVGISTIRLTRTFGTGKGVNHDHIVYYEPKTRTWRSYEKQLVIKEKLENWNVYIFRPPITSHNYFIYHLDSQLPWMKMPNLYFSIEGSSGEQMANLFLKGVPTSQMKQWLLYP